MGRLFGTDGVRGRANELLTAELALDLSVAAVQLDDVLWARGEIGNGGDVLSADHLLRDRQIEHRLQLQDELEKLDRVEIEILVQSCIRAEAVEVGMAHLLAQKLPGGQG
jgi:hypothetical protein